MAAQSFNTNKMDGQSRQFFDLANAEYDALCRYCNAMARISHATNPRSFPVSSDNDSFNYPTSPQEVYNPTLNLSTMLAYRYLSGKGFLHTDSGSSSIPSDPIFSLKACMEEYYTALEDLRWCHSQLKLFVSQQGLKNYDTLVKNESLIEKPILAWMLDHLELSSRVIRTCASSSTSIGFGPFYENGLLKDLNGNDDCINQSWHQVRIVTLASLQANIHRIRRNLNDIFGERDD